MEVMDWDDRYFKMYHKFLSRGRAVAEGTSKGLVYSKHQEVIPPEKVMDSVR